MNPFSALFDLIIPRECHICGESLIDSEEFICSDCAAKLPLTRYDAYWANHTAPNSDLNPMEQRFAGQLPMVHAAAPFFYTRDSALASLVHDFKYRGFSRLAVTLGRLGAYILLPTSFFSGIDIILPIPLHWSKLLRRGYNQTEMIARGISKVTGISVGSQLKARRPHRTQTSLTARQRLENTRDIFSLRNPADLKGSHILLVDDICTTGATLLSAGMAVAASLENDVRLSLFTLGVV